MRENDMLKHKLGMRLYLMPSEVHAVQNLKVGSHVVCLSHVLSGVVCVEASFDRSDACMRIHAAIILLSDWQTFPIRMFIRHVHDALESGCWWRRAAPL